MIFKHCVGTYGSSCLISNVVQTDQKSNLSAFFCGQTIKQLQLNSKWHLFVNRTSLVDSIGRRLVRFQLQFFKGLNGTFQQFVASFQALKVSVFHPYFPKFLPTTYLRVDRELSSTAYACHKYICRELNKSIFEK